jgi:hypothetical protein
LIESLGPWGAPILSFISAILGGLVAHFLSIYRDRASKRRELQTKYLIDIWNDLDAAGNPKDKSDSLRMERAITNIQLFGSEEMIVAARANAIEFAKTGTTDNLPVLNLLRKKLRSDLGLDPTEQKYIALRIMPPVNEKLR